MYESNLNQLTTNLLSNQSLLLEQLDNTNLTLFIEQIKSQNIKFPKSFFYHPELYTNYFYQSDEQINSNITKINKENYVYNGIRHIETNSSNEIIKEVINGELVYKNNEDYYWQFYKRDYSLIFTEFLYVPIRSKYVPLLVNKLPKLLSWTEDFIENKLPLDEVVFKSNIESRNFYYSVITNPSQHPFLANSLYFTGRITFQDNELIYEYQDINGYLGYPSQYYLSRYRPRYLDFILGMPKENEVEKDINLGKCLRENINSGNLNNALSEGLSNELNNELNNGLNNGLNEYEIYYPNKSDFDYLGEYLFIKTNSNYCKEKTFYLYKRKDNSVFLSESEPSNLFINRLAKFKPDLVTNLEIEINSKSEGITIKDKPTIIGLNFYDPSVKNSCYSIDFWGEKFIYQLEEIKNSNLKEIYYTERYFAVDCYY